MFKELYLLSIVVFHSLLPCRFPFWLVIIMTEISRQMKVCGYMCDKIITCSLTLTFDSSGVEPWQCNRQLNILFFAIWRCPIGTLVVQFGWWEMNLLVYAFSRIYKTHVIKWNWALLFGNVSALMKWIYCTLNKFNINLWSRGAKRTFTYMKILDVVMLTKYYMEVIQ